MNPDGVSCQDTFSFPLAFNYGGAPWSSPPRPVQSFVGCAPPVAKSAQLLVVGSEDLTYLRGSQMILIMGMCSVMSHIRVFGEEKVVYWREASGLPQPIHTVAYFLGKDLLALPLSFLGPLMFNILFSSLAAPRASFASFYWPLMAVYYFSASIGYLVSILVPLSLSQLVGVVIVFANFVFVGSNNVVLKNLPFRNCLEVSFLSH